MRISGRGSGVLTHDLRMLFGAGTAAGLTDAQLLKQFVTNHDPGAQAAFAALVARHGPMVWRVCGTTLRDLTDIEDAFQATFLVLARKARSIRQPDSVSSWLFGVALRTASKAKFAAIRRRRHERQWTAAATTLRADEDGDDFASVLWEEVDRLTEKYRAPVVLCYMEGLTHEAAARQLGWPVGTVEGRLARARGLLRSRLSRRGLAPAIGLLGASTSAQATPTAIPGVTADSVARLAMCFIEGKTVANDLVPIRAAAVAKQVLGTMFPPVIKTAMTVVMMVFLTALCAGALRIAVDDPRPPGQLEKGKPSTAPAPAKNLRVLFLMGKQFTWEYKFFIQALARVPNIQCEAILIREPAREGKNQVDDKEFQPGRYDVYVLDELPANALPLREQGLLVAAVERGAGMIMLGGHSSFGDGGWAQSEVARILPILIRPEDGMNEPENGLNLVLTEAGQKSWILQLGPTESDTIKIWGKLPPFLHANRLGLPKAGAQVLARTTGGEPLLVVQAVGKGRVLACAGETWMWARASEEARSIHRKFWQRALAWTGTSHIPPE
jgi:RNA polymerase sigma factor (sigma-70 family)